MEENEIVNMRDDANSRIRRELPTLGLTIIVAILIWVFGALVFIPLSHGAANLGGYPLDQIVSAIILIALIIVVLRAFASIIRLSTGVSEYSAAEISRRNPQSVDRHSVTRIGAFFRAIIYVVVMILIFILLQQYLNTLSPILTGVILVIITIASVIFLYNGGVQISGEVAKLMEGTAQRTSEAFRKGTEKVKQGTEKAKQETQMPPTPQGGQRQTPA